MKNQRSGTPVSLAAAARRHGRSPASVTRAIAGLERAAGEPLMLRSTRSLSLTAAGSRHVAAWREVLARLAELGPSGSRGLTGSLTLTAPELFGRIHVLPILGEFLALHPEMSARLLSADRVVDLIGEGIDIAIRIAPLPDSTLTAARVGQVGTIYCAAPAYVARAGSPAVPSDLAAHDCIGLNVEGEGELWAFGRASRSGGLGGLGRSQRVVTRISTNSASTSIEAALAGEGIARTLSYQVAEHLADGRLVRLLREFEPPATPVHVVHTSGPGRLGPARALIDMLVPRLRGALRAIGETMGA